MNNRLEQFTPSAVEESESTKDVELAGKRPGIKEPQQIETTQEVLADKEITIPEEYPIRTVNDYGDVYFDRVRYNMGKDLKTSKVVKVEEKYGAIIDQYGNITHLFDLISPEEKLHRIKQTGKPNTTIAAKLSEMNLRLIDDPSITVEVIQELQLAIENYHKPAETPKEKMLEFLQQEELLQIKEGLKVWDVEKIKQVDWGKSGRITLSGKEKSKTLIVKGKNYANFTDFYQLLNDEQGVSLEDYEAIEDKAKLIPKKLFYCPKNLTQAFDAQAIKDSNYYLTPWEITKQIPNWGNQVSLPNGEKLTWAELYLPHLIYKELKGRRDEQGNLWVWHQGKEDYVPFSAKLLREVYDINIGSAYDNFTNHPVEYLQEYAPKVLSSEALRLEDFRLIADSATSKLIRKRKVAGRKGAFSWRVVYDLGTEFEGREMVCLSLDEKEGRDLMGVVESRPDGIEEVTHTFRVLPREETEQTKDDYRSSLSADEKYKSGMIRYGLNKLSSDSKDQEKRFDKIELAEYKKTKDNPPLPGESYEDYAERISLVQNFGFIEKVSKELAKDCGIGIHNLSWREQEWLATGWHELASRKEEIKELAKNFGLNGLRSFLSLEYGVKEMGSRVLDLAKHADKKAVKAVLAKYAEIVRAINQTAEYLSENFKADNFTVSQQQVQEITRRLLTKGKDLLINFSDQLSSEQTVETEEVMADLENVKTEVLLLASTFKTISAEQLIDFQEIRNISLEVIPADQITAQDLNSMKQIHLANRSELPKALTDKQLEAFDQSRESGANTYYLVRHEKEGILGFIRFEERAPGEKFATAFNIIASAKSSDIGREFFRQVLEREAAKNKITAGVEPDLPIARNYLEEFGFNITGVDRNFRGSGETFWQITRDNAVNKNLITKDQQERQLVDEAQGGISNTDYEIHGFDLNKQAEEINKLMGEKINQGYVVTRYIKPDKKAGQVYFVLERPKIIERESAV